MVFPVVFLAFFIAIPSGLATCTAFERSRFDVDLDPSAFETAGLVFSTDLHKGSFPERWKHTWVL